MTRNGPGSEAWVDLGPPDEVEFTIALDRPGVWAAIGAALLEDGWDVGRLGIASGKVVTVQEDAVYHGELLLRLSLAYKQPLKGGS
jgi:hypothetical protein